MGREQHLNSSNGSKASQPWEESWKQDHWSGWFHFLYGTETHSQTETQKVFGANRKKGEAINEHRFNEKAVVLLEKEGFGFMIFWIN